MKTPPPRQPAPEGAQPTEWDRRCLVSRMMAARGKLRYWRVAEEFGCDLDKVREELDVAEADLESAGISRDTPYHQLRDWVNTGVLP